MRRIHSFKGNFLIALTNRMPEKVIYKHSPQGGIDLQIIIVQYFWWLDYKAFGFIKRLVY